MARTAARAGKKHRLIVGEPSYNTYFVRTDEGQERRVTTTYVTHRQLEDGTVKEIPWTPQLLIDALQPALLRCKRAYGGTWVLEVYAVDDDPHARGVPGAKRT